MRINKWWQNVGWTFPPAPVWRLDQIEPIRRIKSVLPAKKPHCFSLTRFIQMTSQMTSQVPSGIWVKGLGWSTLFLHSVVSELSFMACVDYSSVGSMTRSHPSCRGKLRSNHLVCNRDDDTRTFRRKLTPGI